MYGNLDLEYHISRGPVTSRGWNIPLWTVSESQDELKHEECQIANFENVVYDRRNVAPEWPAFEMVRCTRGPDDVHDDGTGKPV